MDTGTILGVVAIAVAVAVPFGIERLKRPRLEIVSSQWSPPGFVLWTFATVRIRNRPLSKVLDKLLTRQPVQGCTADIDFYHWDSDACTFTVPGRWSSAPEPLRLVPEDLPTVLPPVIQRWEQGPLLLPERLRRPSVPPDTELLTTPGGWRT